MDVPVAANTLGILGALIPQIVVNARRHHATGLQPSMMMLWAWAGVPLGVYNISEGFNVALRVQPQILTALSLVTWVQCRHYQRKWTVKKSLLAAAPIALAMAGTQAGLILALRALRPMGVRWPATLMAVLSAALLAAGVLRHYWDIYTHRTVRGVSFLFVGIDAAGDVFSLASVFFQGPPPVDVLGVVIYATELLLWMGVLGAGGWYNLRPWVRRKGWLKGGRDGQEGVSAEEEEEEVPLDQSLSTGPATHHARGVVHPTCNRTLIEQATHGCAQLARIAAKQAASGPTDLLRLFFKSADAATRANISRTYDAIADECAAGGTGAVSLSCDSRHYCGPHTAEFTRANSTINLCPNYFMVMRGEKVSDCEWLGYEGFMIHEMSHAVADTEDIGYTYGLRGIAGLSREENVRHADTFAHFANAIAHKCAIDVLKAKGLVHAGGENAEGDGRPAQDGVATGQETRPTEAVPEEAPEGGTPEATPAVVPDGAPEGTPESTGKVTPSEAQEASPQETPEGHPEATSVVAAGGTSDEPPAETSTRSGGRQMCKPGRRSVRKHS
ncbi:PQ loop repeat protein [Purpureocillium lilacinum]|uniref:deuterolysin n=1 Tax=Purpureocillium lilacinum TaxID=33203 RepID=A0A179FUL5_PURLI|nr:PQ loop repeat protein [Purpureocillium lilacinum]